MNIRNAGSWLYSYCEAPSDKTYYAHNGYLLLDDDIIPELKAFVEAGQRIYEGKKGHIAVSDGEPFTNILTAEEFRADRHFGNCDESDSNGILRRLSRHDPAIAVCADMVFEPVDRPFESMLYHLDRPDFGRGLRQSIDTTAHQVPLRFCRATRQACCARRLLRPSTAWEGSDQ